MVGGLDDEGVERARRLDRGDVRLGHFARGEAPGAHPVAHRGEGQVGQFGHYSITLGTAKKPCSDAGALASTLRDDAAVGDDVVAPAQRVRDHRRHRLDPGGVDLAELLDPRQDAVQLPDQRRGLAGVELDPRQLGDAGDGGGIDHAARVAWGPRRLNPR